ncbi:protein HflC [Tistrella bauzanensis]|uniref:Protein HflC n=1 Tax=Tistrella bauzanensis TaxID=657419 RepID=A0ABQ1IEI2_9PROT|nr:protease modulator HflC [Tistrella bauzanensis]GGB37527.1 protein HflC [Tistrella bauzanensis]
MRKGLLTIAGIAAVAVAIVGISASYVVHQTEQALVLQLGEPRKVVKEPGLHFKLPFIQNVVFYDNRVLDFDADVQELIASDQKRLVVDSFARFRIVDPLRFYQAVGSEAVVRARLDSIVNASLRNVLGSVPLSSVLTSQRAELMAQTAQIVNGEAKSFGIEVLDVRMRRVDLPEANSQAIFSRMRTEREREATELRAQGAELAQRIRSRADRERTVLLAEARREAQIARGEGDATASKIFADSFGQDAAFFDFYRSLQAYRAALGNSDTTMLLSPNGEFFRYFGSDGTLNLPGGNGAAPAALAPAPAG